jgi:hypothetical protein
VGGKTAPTVFIKKKKSFRGLGNLRTPVSPARGFFYDQPHNSAPYTISTDQLGPEVFGTRIHSMQACFPAIPNLQGNKFPYEKPSTTVGHCPFPVKILPRNFS